MFNLNKNIPVWVCSFKLQGSVFVPLPEQHPSGFLFYGK
jgi:hypothetical protein